MNNPQHVEIPNGEMRVYFEIMVQSSLAHVPLSGALVHMPLTVRDHVHRIQGELRKGALEPDTAREHLITLSALYGNVLQEIREADAAYAVVLLAHLESSEKANRAKIRAETSDEYQRRQEARNLEKLVQEMTRALKYLLRSLEEELRLAR